MSPSTHFDSGGGVTPAREVSATPWIDCAVVYGAFLATFLVAFWASWHVRRTPSTMVALEVIPYLVILLFVVWRRSRGHPYFPIGSPALAFKRALIVWILGAGIATYTAFRQGAFGPQPIEWRVNTFLGDPLLAVVAEECAFRGAILTALNATRLGTRSFLGLRLGTLVSAVAFSAVHLLALLGGMPLKDAPLFAASALVAGIVFGYLYQRTQNLWYGIFFHALGNFSQLLP